jgi:hypothetical protein
MLCRAAVSLQISSSAQAGLTSQKIQNASALAIFAIRHAIA